ncbi:MAG: toxin-antitoxin system protein [Chloroflexi bacterium]|nr:toxin-antitoxin system protein [Chloroflexota bacterium]
MTVATIEIPQKTRDALQAIAQEEGVSMQQVVEEALEVYRRQRILEATNKAYAELRADKEAWTDLQEERRIWDVTLADGLEGVK